MIFFGLGPRSAIFLVFLGAKKVREIADEYLNMVGLTAFADRFPSGFRPAPE